MAKYNMTYVIFFFTAFLLGCSSSKSTTHFKGQAMTMRYHVVIGKNLSKYDQKKVNQVILEVFKQTDRIFNNWNPSSEISKINQNQSCKPLAISFQLGKLLECSDKCYKITKQRFDPTIGTIFNAWKFALTKKKYPSNLELKAVGWDNIYLNKLSLQKKYPKCQLDLCGISKGYTIDLLTEELTNLGYYNFLIEWGGEIFAKGMHPKRRKWKILVQNISKDNQVLIQDRAIATSGSFMLDDWNVKDKSYFHIFDPKLKRPLEKADISTISVIAPYCYLADALATAAMTFTDFNELKTWCKEITQNTPKVSFIIVNSKKQIIDRITNERCNFF